jgi:hypothetical protein
MDILLPILCVVVVILIIWTWLCCKKAREAWRAAQILYEWVNTVNDPLVCAVAKTECEPGAGPGWPPDSIGSFPPSDA